MVDDHYLHCHQFTGWMLTSWIHEGKRTFLFNSLASLASFCLWAKILAYSAAASLFFSPLLLLRASLCLFLCNITGVTNLWTLGALYFCFLPSFKGRGLLITY